MPRAIGAKAVWALDGPAKGTSVRGALSPDSTAVMVPTRFVLPCALVLAACGTTAAPGGGGASDVLVLGDAGSDVVLGGEDGGVIDLGFADVAQDLGAGECVPNSTDCDGDVLLTCASDGSAVGRTRCSARGQVCVEEPSGASCGDPICAPSVWECVSDTDSAQCNETGGAFALAEACSDGCDSTTGRCAGVVPVVECAAFEVEAIEPGTHFFDLCNASNTAEHSEQNDCSPGGAESGGDGIFSITLDRPTQISLDLRDEDGSAAIDTIMYLRTVCDDPGSQVDCSDDVPCGESDVPAGDCSGDVQVRQSRIDRRLDPGTYYLWIDHLNYRNFGCGDVRLVVGY